MLVVVVFFVVMCFVIVIVVVGFPVVVFVVVFNGVLVADEIRGAAVVCGATVVDEDVIGVVNSVFFFAESVDVDRYFEQSHGTVVSFVSSVVVSGTGVVVVLLGISLTVVSDPAGCCVELFV